MWLDSYDGVHIDSKFDIMVWQPSITLVTIAQQTRICQLIENTTERAFDDPLALVKKISNAIFFTIYRC